MTTPSSLSELVDFNRIHRDTWMAHMARKLPAGTRVLDVGAGPCRYRPLFAHCRYETQDFAQYTADDDPYRNWKYGELDYVCDATSIPVLDGSFGAVLCTEVLEHVPEPVNVIQEISRILAPGGSVFITAPLCSGLHQQPYHFYGGYTPHFYNLYLPQHNLEVLSIQPNGGFFRFLLQEIHRGVNLVSQAYPRWHPTRLTFRLAATRSVAQWLTRLDDRIASPTHTVGYFVEARKAATE